MPGVSTLVYNVISHISMWCDTTRLRPGSSRSPQGGWSRSSVTRSRRSLERLALESVSQVRNAQTYHYLFLSMSIMRKNANINRVATNYLLDMLCCASFWVHIRATLAEKTQTLLYKSLNQGTIKNIWQFFHPPLRLSTFWMCCGFYCNMILNTKYIQLGSNIL